jgi:hypothetical protein
MIPPSLGIPIAATTGAVLIAFGALFGDKIAVSGGLLSCLVAGYCYCSLRT